jgi:uncharacterized membrane protein YfcA
VDTSNSLKPTFLLLVCTILMLLYAFLLETLGLFAPGASMAALVAVFTAATAASIAGFAFSPICAAMLMPLMHEPVQVVKILLLSSIAIQALSVWALRRSVDWWVLLPFLAGGLVGLPGGIYLLLHMQPAHYVRLLGILLVLYGAYMLFRKPLTVRSRPIHDAIVGVAGGVTGGLAAFPGAIVTIWCGTKGWYKAHQRGVYQPFILVMQLLALLMIQCVTPITPGAGLGAAAWTFIPAALLGTCCGLAIFKRLTDWQFAAAVNLLLIVSGLGLAI